MALRIVKGVKNRIKFYRDYLLFKKQKGTSAHDFFMGEFWPCINDWNESSGTASGHYFHQDLIVAQKIYLNNPTRHVDVGSRIDGFVAHVASFRQIEVFDVRPLRSSHPNIIFVQADFMGDCSRLKAYCDSLSCLHALEHFGLGRYGDPVDYEGHLKGLKNFVGMLRMGGKFYFSVPIGPQRVEFNAHRVFGVRYLMELLKNWFKIDSFSYVDDDGNIHQDVIISDSESAIDTNFGCVHGCGIFELTKVADWSGVSNYPIRTV